MNELTEAQAQQVRAVGLNYRTQLRAAGEVLLDIEQARNSLLQAKEILALEFGMARATADVAVRWAKGDYGDDDTAALLVGKMAHSTLTALTKETIAELKARTFANLETLQEQLNRVLKRSNERSGARDQ